MAWIWVQVPVWRLPTIHESFMSDIPGGTPPVGDLHNAPQGSRSSSSQLPPTGPYDSSDPRRTYYPSPQPTAPQSNFQQMSTFSQQHNPQPGRQDSFGMSGLGSALPEVYQNYGGSSSQQRYPSTHATSSLQYPQQNMQYAVPAGMTSSPYNVQFQPQYQGMYAPNPNQSQSGHGAATTGMANQFYQAPYMNQTQQAASSFYAQAGQYAGAQMMAGNVSAGQYGGRGFAVDGRPTQYRGTDYLPGPSGGGDPGRSASICKEYSQKTS